MNIPTYLPYLLPPAEGIWNNDFCVEHHRERRPRLTCGRALALQGGDAGPGALEIMLCMDGRQMGGVVCVSVLTPVQGLRFYAR